MNHSYYCPSYPELLRSRAKDLDLSDTREGELKQFIQDQYVGSVVDATGNFEPLCIRPETKPVLILIEYFQSITDYVIVDYSDYIRLKNSGVFLIRSSTGIDVVQAYIQTSLERYIFNLHNHQTNILVYHIDGNKRNCSRSNLTISVV
jgi:hypothetical protein